MNCGTAPPVRGRRPRRPLAFCIMPANRSHAARGGSRRRARPFPRARLGGHFDDSATYPAKWICRNGRVQAEGENGPARGPGFRESAGSKPQRYHDQHLAPILGLIFETLTALEHRPSSTVPTLLCESWISQPTTKPDLDTAYNHPTSEASPGSPERCC